MRKAFAYIILTTVVSMAAGPSKLYSQTDSANAYEGMSLKDLLNVKIVSVSKTSESLFEAPLSASVVTKEDIQRAGCTSMMEALRLVPGLIVREQTNGNYEVQVRGVYATPNAFFDGSSGTTLVMVDNRPIFNYLKGSTFWATIPVDLNDVEKIEIVRGPAGALYGPNAVNGVIHIITRQAAKNGLYALANSQQGMYHTLINNASIGYKADKWGFIASGNFQHRERTQTSYFEFFRNDWVEPNSFLISELADTLHDARLLVPDPELSMDKYGANIFVHYDPLDKVHFNISTGLQHSLVQKVFAENGVGPLTTSSSNSRYVDLRAAAGQFSGQVSYISGVQSADAQPGNKYDFQTFDAAVGYNYAIGDLQIKPGVSYRSAVYDDTKYSDIINKTGIFNARGEIITHSASLRSEYRMLQKKLRLVAGLASNTFNYPDKTYLSYEFAATYKINKNHLVRAVYSSTPRSGSVYDTYVDQSVPGTYPLGDQKYLMFRLEGNKNTELLKAHMLEIGYRVQLLKGLNVDIELFHVRTDNYSVYVMQASRKELWGTDTIMVTPLSPTNLPVIGGQNGGTASLTYSHKKWQIRPYITVQHSTLKNYAPYTNIPDAPVTYIQANPQQNNIYSGIGSEMELTSAPTTFGGLIVNYSASDMLNVNLNAYYLGAQRIYHSSYVLYNDGVRGIDPLKAKCIVNANVAYKLSGKLQMNINCKNILNDTSREFYKTDRVPFQLLGGIHYQL